MTAAERPKDPRQQLAAFSLWAKIPPEERSRLMSERGKASAAKRAAERAAAGIVSKPRPRNNAVPLPSYVELEPYLLELDAKPQDPPLTYDARYRQAVLRLRLDIAAQTVKALKGPQP